MFKDKIISKTILMKKRITFFVILFQAILTGSGSAQTEKGWVASRETEERLSKSRQEFNYFEDKVKPYSLPDVLTSPSGRKIITAGDWQKFGRPEMMELFRNDVFGRVPSTPYKKSYKIVTEDKNALGGTATFKLVDVTITSGSKSLVIHLNLYIPNKVKKPVPAFLLINLGAKGIDPTRQAKSESWPAEEIVGRGYAAAVFSNADVDPDNFDEFKNGIHALLDKTPRSDDAWGTLAAWAWGASRCMDYLVTDKDIAKNKVAVVGHSRGGKTALWAGAEDERFSLVVANESGAGGAAIARRRLGETVARLNSSFPHWFCTNYRKFNNNEDSMPFDMHMLLALTAPRALYIDAAAEDLWGDPKGCYLSLYNSLPVFRLYDKSVSLPETVPPLNKQVISGKAGFHIRDGEHALKLTDWNMIMDFASVAWKNK
jgi:pimeloyl-ACP methyl ester carboxylesterase